MKKVLVGLLALSPFGLIGPIAAQDSGILLDQIIAVADEGVVLRSELDRQVDIMRRRLLEGGIPFSEEDLEKQVLDALIVKRIQLQMADARGIRVSDTQLNQALDRIARQNGLTLLQLPAALATDGIDYSDFREDLRQDIIISQLTQIEVSRSINITEKEIDSALDSQEGLDSREFDLGHILVAVSSNASLDEVEKQRRRAQEVLDRAEAGENFAQLAVAYSNGQQALNGGSLGWRTKTDTPTLFADEIRDMGAGDVAGLIRSSSGFHIIKVHDVRGGDKVMVQQYRARHILLRTNEVISNEQAESVLADFRRRIEEGEDFAEIAKKESEDPGSALEGGDLGWATPDIFDPSFAQQMVSLSPGEMSQPFRSQFGWHLMQLMETRDYDATEEAMRNRAIGALRRRKMEEGTQLWLQRIRDQAYIESRI